MITSAILQKLVWDETAEVLQDDSAEAIMALLTKETVAWAVYGDSSKAHLAGVFPDHDEATMVEGNLVSSGKLGARIVPLFSAEQ